MVGLPVADVVRSDVGSFLGVLERTLAFISALLGGGMLNCNMRVREREEKFFLSQWLFVLLTNP